MFYSNFPIVKKTISFLHRGKFKFFLINGPTGYPRKFDERIMCAHVWQVVYFLTFEHLLIHFESSTKEIKDYLNYELNHATPTSLA
jgi:hypothetical protein